MSGVLFSVTARFAVTDTSFYLTAGWGDNKQDVPPVFMGVATSDILSRTDSNGNFSLTNIPPGTYYLLMAAPPYDWALGYKDTNLTAYRIDITEGQKLAAGVVYVYWP